MRDRLWNLLFDVKFKAVYTCECSKRASTYSRTFSFLLAITSIASAATWAILQQHPFIWAAVVAVAQLLQIAQPFIRFLKNERLFLAMSFKYEALYLKCEKLWCASELEEINHKTIEKRYYKYRQEAVAIEKEHEDVVCPTYTRWMQKAEREAEAALRLNLAHKETNDVQKPATETQPAQTKPHQE